MPSGPARLGRKAIFISVGVAGLDNTECKRLQWTM
jgi:hypothetical protein